MRCEQIANGLHNRDQHKKNNHGDDGRVGLVALETVADGIISQAAAAHAARHGGEREQVHDGDGRAADHAGAGLRAGTRGR